MGSQPAGTGHSILVSSANSVIDLPVPLIAQYTYRLTYIPAQPVFKKR